MIGKVRVWDHKRKYFITDSYENCMYLRFDGTLVFITTVGEEMNPRGDYTIQRFVGLLDKNGREIYEGDIVKFRWYDYDSAEDRLIPRLVTSYILEREKSYQKLYFAPTFGTELDDISESPLYGELELVAMEWETSEVIGNIFETPELLVKH